MRHLPWLSCSILSMKTPQAARGIQHRLGAAFDAVPDHEFGHVRRREELPVAPAVAQVHPAVQTRQIALVRWFARAVFCSRAYRKLDSVFGSQRRHFAIKVPHRNGPPGPRRRRYRPPGAARAAARGGGVFRRPVRQPSRSPACGINGCPAPGTRPVSAHRDLFRSADIFPSPGRRAPEIHEPALAARSRLPDAGRAAVSRACSRVRLRACLTSKKCHSLYTWQYDDGL